ncbi:MAG: polyphenol oxidase family protein [Patescibacteria group bacterium]
MNEQFPTTPERESSHERIEEGVWRPGSLDRFTDKMAAGASTKELERRSPDAPLKPRMRITGDVKRTIQDPEELAAALEEAGSVDSVETFRDKKIVAGMLLTRMLRQLDPEADPRDILKTRLVHGADIAVVDEAYAARPKEELAAIEADGMITKLKHRPLMIAAADCAPIIFYDPANEALGVFHSGYKGTLAQIGRRGIEAMSKAYGSRPEDLRTVIGPYADGESYEVGQDVYDRFLHATDDDVARYSADEMAEMFRPDPRKADKHLFDNGKAIEIGLRHAGVRPEHLEISGYSTMRDNHLFSSDRKEGSKDRDSMLIMAVLK